MIKEYFLHYLWKHKLYNTSNLKGTNNENIQIINAGIPNKNAGPDFFNAQIKIDGQLWAGNVEIHIKTSDWYVHNHERDKAYDNVILHVVWEDDVPVFDSNNLSITTLVLKKYVAIELVDSYYKLFSQKQLWINCQNDIHKIDSFLFDNWKERLYIERLHHKSTQILSLLEQSKNNWEVVLFKMLAKNFGLKVNGEAFMYMANSFDFSLIRKNQNDIIQLEALFFGQSGMLCNTIQDMYYINLQKEYQFLKHKYGLNSLEDKTVKFFRLRPNNFPTIRLSQLARLYVLHPNLFSELIDLNTVDAYYNLLKVTTSAYWETHYSFRKLATKRKKNLTKSFIDLLLINTIIPLKFVYQKYVGKLQEDAILELIQQIKSENNSIITKFSTLKINAKNALESQALLQLKNEYCAKQKCLQCAIGNCLLKNN